MHTNIWSVLLLWFFMIGSRSAVARADDGDVTGSTDEATATADAESRDSEPTGYFVIGVGYLPDDGFIAAATVAQPRLFGSDAGLSLSTQISQRQSLMRLRLSEPGLLGSDFDLEADVTRRQQRWPGFERSSVGGAITLSRPLADHTRGFLSYRLEDVSTRLTEPDAAARIIGPGATRGVYAPGGLLASLRAGVEYDSRDESPWPRRGSSAGLWVESASAMLGSDVELVRGRVWASHHRGLGPFTLHLSGGAAGVVSPDPRGVPLSERLQLDGSSELRGSAPGALGPIDASSGVALGGNLKLGARAELELPLAPGYRLSAIAFADAAALVDLEGRGQPGMGMSVGGGLRWQSPIGPVTAAIAQSLDGEDPVFLISLGLAF